jgi:hypothetical protein
METTTLDDFELAAHFGLSIEVHRRYSKEIAVFYQVMQFEDVLILKDGEGRDRWQMVLPEVSDNAKWRTQSFDLNGFEMHMIFHTKEEAVESAIRCGFHIRDDQALDRVQDLTSFQLGNFATEQLGKHNCGEISYRQYLESVLDYSLV